MQDIFSKEQILIIINILIISTTIIYILNNKEKNTNIILSILFAIALIFSLVNINIDFSNMILTKNSFNLYINNKINNDFFNVIEENKKKFILNKEMKISKKEYDCLLKNEKEINDNCIDENYYKNLNSFFKEYNKIYKYDKNNNNYYNKEELEKNETDKIINNLIIIMIIKIWIIIILISIITSFINRLSNIILKDCMNIKQTYSFIIFFSFLISCYLLINEFKVLQFLLYDLNKLSATPVFIFSSICVFVISFIISLNKMYINLFLLGKEDNIIVFNKEGKNFIVYKIGNNKVLLLEKNKNIEKIKNLKEKINEKDFKIKIMDKNININYKNEKFNIIRSFMSIEEFEEQKIIFESEKESEIRSLIYSLEDKDKIKDINKNRYLKIALAIISLIIYSMIAYINWKNKETIIFIISILAVTIILFYLIYELIFKIVKKYLQKKS